MDEMIAPVLRHLDVEDPGIVAGAYLYGSASIGGLRPDSDVDLLVLTRRSLTRQERRTLIDVLLGVSGWRGHASTFPEVADRRPLDLTSLVLADLQPLVAAPRLDLQFGEWLRADLAGGEVPEPASDPDVVTQLASAQDSHRVLRGPELDTLIDPVPREALRDAQQASVPPLLDELEGDERNVLLTLARILVTVRTGRIVAKDAAAEAVMSRLDGPDRDMMVRAQREYRDGTTTHWGGDADRAAECARTLARLI